jgi:hypothetical protein
MELLARSHEVERLVKKGAHIMEPGDLRSFEPPLEGLGMSIA